MNATELTYFINTLANIAAKDLSDDELALFSSMFMQFGDTLGTIGILRSLQTKA